MCQIDEITGMVGTMKLDRKSLFKEVRDYVMITIAMLSYCIGWTVFLLPNNITTGGVPGIASIIYWGAGIPVQITYFGINAILMVLALRILGLKFCYRCGLLWMRRRTGTLEQWFYGRYGYRGRHYQQIP